MLAVGQLERAVAVQAREVPVRGGVLLVVLDADGCPAVVGLELLTRGSGCSSRQARRLRHGQARVRDLVPGRPPDQDRPTDPEGSRGAKEELGRRRGRYRPAADQAGLAATLELDLPRRHAPSFDKAAATWAPPSATPPLAGPRSTLRLVTPTRPLGLDGPAGYRRPAVRWPPRFEAGSLGRAWAGPEGRQGPDLLPGDVVALLHQRCIQRGNILRLFQGAEQPLVELRADQDGCGGPVDLEHDRLRAGSVDHLGHVLPGLPYLDRSHRVLWYRPLGGLYGTDAGSIDREPLRALCDSLPCLAVPERQGG